MRRVVGCFCIAAAISICPSFAVGQARKAAPVQSPTPNQVVNACLSLGQDACAALITAGANAGSNEASSAEPIIALDSKQIITKQTTE